MNCVCATVCFSTPLELEILRDGRHHPVCPLHKTEKHPRLFYYEEAHDCWAPAPELVENIVSLEMLDDGDRQEVEFKCRDMTDEEFYNLPED